MILTKTPFRMSFVGGGSDMQTFYKEHDGAVLSTSINKYIYVAVNGKFDGKITLSYSQTENVDAVSKIKHPLIRESLMECQIDTAIEISSLADIPSNGTGLGSSSSFTVGLNKALTEWKGGSLSKAALAERACKIEIENCGEPIGKQDQYAASFGGLNYIRFKGDGSVDVEPVQCAVPVKNELNAGLQMFFTGRHRSASKLLEKQNENLNARDKKTLMRRMVALACEMRQELESGQLDSFGDMLHENWQLKTQMSNEITNGELDELYAIARNNGAKGGKMLGAGGGGFLLVFTPLEKQAEVSKALSFLREVPFDFEEDGSSTVFNSVMS